MYVYQVVFLEGKLILMTLLSVLPTDYVICKVVLLISNVKSQNPIKQHIVLLNITKYNSSTFRLLNCSQQNVKDLRIFKTLPDNSAGAS